MGQRLIRIAFVPLIALAFGLQIRAADRPIEFSYQQASQTVLNPDGGPWAHLDLMTASTEQQAFGDATFMLNRQPANLLSWELGPSPYWGIHDDHYATDHDAGRNTGYFRLFSKAPMYLVLADSDGKQAPLEVFQPVPVPFDLRDLPAVNGEGAVTVNLRIPFWLRFSESYSVALWIPEADPVLATIPEYDYLLNNENIPNPDTGLNILFPVGDLFRCHQPHPKPWAAR